MSSNDQFDPSRAVPLNSAASQKPEDDFNPGRAVPLNADNALVRGWKSMSNSVGITKDLATGDAAAVARRVKEFDDYNRVNPGSQQGQELSKAWEQGDGITGGIKGVAGEIAKDWKEAPNWVGGVRSVAGNAKAMGDGLVAQVPNMLAPMVGMVGGGVAGGAAAGPVGLAAGAWAGASAGNALVEGGGMLMDRLNKAGINPQDTAAVEKFTREQGDAALGDAAIKGAIIGAVDAATAGAGGKILNAPARAAADRALTKMGVDMTDGAAVKAAQKSDAFKDLIAKDATFQAASSGTGNVARNVGVAALDPAGEFAGEFVGQGVATGDWDTKNAALEAISSVGQSAIMYGGQKAYQAATSPLRDKRASGTGTPNGSPEAGTPEPLLLTNQPPDTLFTHPDGSTGRLSEMESYLSSLNDGTPAGERRMMKERARLLGYSSPEPYEFEIPDLVPWQEDYRNHSFGLPYQPLQDHLGAVQAAIRGGTQFSDQQTVDAVRTSMEDAWLEANVKQQPASAVEAAGIAGQQMGQELAAAVPGEAVSTAAVDAQVRTSRILSGLQNAMDSGAMGTAQSINYLNEALTRIGEQPLAQDEAARARRLLDAHAAFTGKSTPAPLPGDLAAQNPLVDEFADNAALESLVRRKPSERLGIDPSAGPNSKAAAMAVDAAQSEPAAAAIDAAQPLSLQNPLLALSSSRENAAQAASPFNINGDLDGREADQAQQIAAQQAQARPAQGSEAGRQGEAGGQGQSVSGIGTAPGHLGEGVGHGSAPAINNRPQEPAQNAAQGQAPAAQVAAKAGADNGGQRSDSPTYSAQNESSESNNAIDSEAKQAGQQGSDAMTIGSTPKTGDAVSVRDGVVYLGNYEALDYDSGEPITVPAGATRGQVAQALRDGGVLTDRQKVFGLKDREHESMAGFTAPTAQAPAAAPAPAAATPASNLASQRQQKAIERINSEKGAYFFSKPKAEAFLADNDLQDGYEVVQQEKAFAIKAKQAAVAAAEAEAATAGAGQSVANQNPGTGIAGRDLGDGWAEFAPESGTKAVPRAEMPQIKAEHRGAMVNFMNARGVAHEEATVPASSLKPTQREFSREKVEKAKAYAGGNRAILASSDGHVLDGHHQWVAALESGEDVRTIRLSAPIDELVKLAHDFPSSTVADGAETGQSVTADRGVEAPESATQSNADFLKALAQHRKELPDGFEIVPMGDTISLKEGGKFAVNGLSRDRAGVAEALRLAQERDQKNKAGSASTAPEHAQVGVDDRELGEIVSEFNAAQASMQEDGEQIHHLFDEPAKGEVVRLADKVKVFTKDKGWMTPAEAKAEIAKWKAHAKAQGQTRANADKVVLSLFDYTGKWSAPWEEAGYQVYRFDIQADPQTGDVTKFSAEFFADWFGDFDGMDIYAILAACPCTDFASSGARHFAAKDADGRTVASVRLVHQTLATIEHFKPAVWAVENPVGRIEKLGGLPAWRLSFDPNHIGDPYTKKTLIWGRFNGDMPIAPVEPTEGSKMHSQYGGKSLATKNARSATPEGFAYGFFMANNAVDHPVMALANKFDRLDRTLIDKAINAGVSADAITDAVEDLYYMDLDDAAANDAIRALVAKTAPEQVYTYGGKPAVQYRNPATGQTWTGRGKAPKWIDGKDYAQFAVKDVTDVTPKGEQSVIDKIQAAKGEAERTVREDAAKKAAEQEARKASREVERDLFRQLTGANGGLVGKSLDQVTAALKLQLGSRDASTALNPVQISRLARAIHKQLQAHATQLAKEAARDPQVKADAQAEALGNAFGEDVSPQSKGDFLLGFDHALAGKTKSTLSGAGLADMVKGYEAAGEWMGTEEGAAWFEGKRRKKLENTGVDLRRHWEAMKAQMKAGESDMQKAWKQIEAATNRAELFAPYLPEGSTPGWVAYVTQLRGLTKTFKQFLFDGRSSWYGSVSVGRKGKDAANLEFVLEGKRYPGDMSIEQRQQWQTDPVFRMAQLRDAAELYIEKVQQLTAFLDGATSLTEAAERFVATMVAEQHQEKARNRDTYYSRYERINADHLSSVLHGVHGGGVFDRGIWNGDSYDFTKFRAASPWASGLIANEATHELPTRATPLTPPKLDRVDRAMSKDHRGGKDVTPSQFKAQFGFADVGFGNWVGAKNDQDHLNYAFDAFMDLAEHFGFAPKNIGLGGVLHFTVGALGHGKFAAHFSPNHPGPNGRVQVVNLTNTKGDGTVYHEWAHALDHNLGGEWDQVKRMILNAFKFKAYEASDWERVARNFLVGGSYWQGNKNQDKVEAAIQGLRYYANSGASRGLTAYKDNADKLGKDYWGNDAELFARAIEAWSADSLGGTNSYLVNRDWVGDGKVTQASGYRGTPYPTGGERAVFGKYLTALAKSVKFTDGKPTVTVADFEKNLPADIGTGEVRRRELLSKEGMQAYFEQVQEERAMAAEEKARLELEKQAEDKAKVDALAEQALAELEAMSRPAVVDAPAASEARGPLTDDDLSAIFDQAAAELREQTQEQPNVPATNEAGTISATTADTASAVAVQVDMSAAKLIAEAAKLGVTGANEALSGLAKLFGGGKGGRLNSFPAGFDEETYKAAKPHFKAALVSFQAAGKSLKDLFKLLIQNFGDGVKDYAIQFAKDEGLTAQLGKAPDAGAARSPSGVLANWVKAQLERGEAEGSFDWRALFEQADSAFGGTQGEGKYTPKDAYDAMEAGVNQFILSRPGEFNPRASQDAAHIIVERLHRITQMLPTQTKRTAEQDEFQQFSTVPALAYAANWAANMDSTDTMMEPSAGIGGLAAFAKNAGAKLILNELSSRRAAVLREVFPSAKVFTENAEQIDNILPATAIPSVVVMNPPFSATAGRIQGKRDTHVGAQHVEQGLKRLADGGRLVAIVGEGMNLDRPAFADWWKNIRAKYDVRAVIPMDGSGYAKYGTTFDNAILVIDKVKPSNRPIVTTPAKTYSDLIGSLAEIRNDRPESVFPSNDRDGLELDAAEHALAESSQAGGGSAQPEQSGRDQRSDVGRAKSGRGQGLGAGSGGRSGAGGSGGTRDNGSESGPGRTAGNDDAGGSRDAAAAGGRGSDAAQSAVSIQATEQTGDPDAGLSDSIFESYQPQRLQVPGAKAHPGPLVQSSAMAAVLPPVPTYTPNLPKETIEKGLLSLAQIEAVVYAGQAHQELLEPVTVDGKDVAYRRGFFIGDGTGVGKGREISGIILDNLRQGREKAVWISEKPGLLPDAQRDFSGVGGDPKQIFNVSKTKAEDQINADKGIAFLSYATLRSGAKSQENVASPTTKAQFAQQFPKGLDVVTTNGRGTFPLDHIDPKDDGGKVWVKVGGELKFIRYSSVESIGGQSDWQSGRATQSAKGSKKEGQSRLDQLVNWLGKDFDGVIAFDEAHNAGNAVAQKGTRGQSQPSAQALAVVELQKRLPNARVVYVSATGATQVSNLSFATRLGLWGPATPFASVQNFIAEMTAGGLAAMELVARDLKQMGAYMARSLSFEGVTYSRVEHQLTPLQQDIYNRLAEAWQVTLQNIDAALKTTGAVGENGKGSSSAKSAAMSAYWGAQQRFFSQVITSMQMPSVLEQMERDVADGKALVLQLVNTNEAQQNRSIAKRRGEDESADLEELDLTPRDVLMQMVEKSFPVTQFEEQEDDSGKKIRVPAKDSQGNPVINREAVAMREALLKDLKDIRVPDGPLEIVLNHFGVDKVAEVTGRTQRVVRKLDKDGELRAQLESRGPASARADANAFMADQKPILVFSDAGGTGYSFHADNTQKNKRKRSHYLIQPGWRADKAVQGFGRTHRTNQASAPHYYLASTNVPSQKRFLSAIARRLDQLGALTKGQRDTANQGMFSEKDNLESIYATQAVQQFFKDGQHQQLDGISFAEFLRQTGLESIIDEETNRIAEDRMPDTRTFLNRMLSLKLDMQEKVFDAFMLRMEEKVEMAVERGEFDAGLQTIRALESRVVSDDLAYTDPRSGAETRLVELELTQPTTIYAFPHSLLKAEYVVNVKSGKVYAKTLVGKSTTKEGAIVDRFRVYGTGSVQSKTAPEIGKAFRGSTKAEAMKLWAAENEARPKTYTERKHMIVGAMLPIWDRLKTDGSIQVARTMTVDGNRLLGRLIDKKSLPDVRKRLNVSSAASKMSPAQVMAQILKGDKAELANGWSLERARVSDDLRIELKNPSGGYISPAVRAELVGIGLVSERISWAERLFVPTGATGVPVLERLTKNRPVVDLQSEQDTSEAHFGDKTASPIDTFPAEFMAELAAVDDLFVNPRVNAGSAAAALRQVDASIQFVGDVTAEDERSESGADTKRLFRTGNGRDFYVFEKGNELWLDVSRLGEGDGGSTIYAALMDYAAGNEKVFIGDPAGLSDIAMRRRLEAMISSAIKQGSTDHMEPHARQVEGDEKLGIPALKWRQGDTIGNIQRMIDVSLASISAHVPEFARARYDFATGTFRTGAGKPLPDGMLRLWSEHPRMRAAGVGRRSIKRGILLNTLAHGESSQRPGLLEQALRQPGQLVGEQAKGIFYTGASRSQPQPGSRTDRAVMDMVREGKTAADILGLIASTSKTPFNRKLAAILVKTGATPRISMGGEMGADGGFTFLAKYSRKLDELSMSEGAARQAEQIFLHEMTHAATLRSLDRKGVASLQMRKLYEYVKKQGGAAGTYGMKNVGEFVAEAFTNPEFQRALRGMKAPAGSSLQNAWDAFVRVLKALLGLPAKSEDALSRALELGVQVMREDRALRRVSQKERATQSSARQFLDGKAVATMRGDEVPRLGGQALVVNWAAKHFESVTKDGAVMHPELGEIKLDRRSAKDSLSHGYGKDKVQALYLLPEVLPKARVLHTESRKEGQTGYVLGAPVEIGGKAYVAAMVVTQHEGRTGLYVHEVVLREKLQSAINTGAPAQSQGDIAQSSRGNPGAILSVLERIYAVNPGANPEDVAHFGVSDAAEAAKNIGQGLKAITATDVKKAGSHKLTDWLKLGLQFMGRRQLVDIYGDTLPMAEYDRLVAQMEADKNDVGAEADNLATRWGKLTDEVQLSELMHDATLAEIDADSTKEHVEGDNKAQSAALKRRFDALSSEAKAVYREARDHYREHHKQVRNAIRERIMRAELSSKKRQELLEKMDADFFGYVKGVYFPLARFGQYVVATKDQDGKVISVSRAETMTEAERMRDEMRKAFPAAKGFNVGRVTLSKDFVATHDMVGRGFMSEVFAALDKHEIPADKRAELEDTLGQLYLSSLPDLSWAKHGIHRKGTPGFSQDARRAFAQNSFHGARYLAKLRYSDLMADELDNMQKHVDTMGAFKEDFDQPKAQRVVDEMQKRHDQLMNPKTNSLSTALTSFGFIFHLGLSPAAAMVNLSQTALVAYPVMGAKWGFKKSAAALLRASNESVKGKNDIRTQLKDKDELSAYDEAVRSGVIDVTMAHDLAGIAQGEDAGVMWKLRPVMRAASFLFHHAERFNRQATFIAAYRLARDAGSDHYKAYEEAVKATYDGHFDYGSANRPRLMQGNVARVVLLFKQFAQNMIYTLGRNAYLAAKGDKQALKTFAGVITMHAAGAGVLGLPLVGPLLALASALGGDDDDPWDAEIALRNMLADVFGQQVSEVIAKGFSRLTPWDISGRVGLDNLIFPDIREGLEGKMWAQEMATGLLGPVVGIGINGARGAQLLAEGDFMRGLENMMPVVPRNAIKSARFLQEGAKDSTGITIKDDVSALGIAGQLVGFSPSEVRLAFEGRSAVMNTDRRLNVRRAELLGQFSHAVMKKDSEAQAEAREEIKAFNEKNPGRRITSPQMWQSVRARQRRIDQAQDGVYLPRNRRDAMDAGGFAF